MKNNEDGIYISIKPKFVELILEGKKNHEFRKYIPNKKFNRIYIYETIPKSRIKYVIDIAKISIYPEKIDTQGIGNIDFNKGMKKSKYAYKLGKIYFLKDEIGLKELKSIFHFVPPQSFAYVNKYKDLTQYINNNLKEL